MTWNDLDTWWVIYSKFVCVDSKHGIHFALNNDSEAQDTPKVRFGMTKNNKQRKRPLACVTLRDLDPGTTVYGS